MILGKTVEKYQDYLYLLFRLLVGAMFMMHGLQKFGLFGGTAAEGIFMLAGVFEVLIGPALILGVFVRLAAVGGIVEMLYAYVAVHMPNGLSPLANRGELALMYLAAFLVVLAYGSGKFCLEKAVLKKEIF